MSDEKNKDLTCENRDRPARTGATAKKRSGIGGVDSPPVSMKDEDSHPNSSDVEALAESIELVDVDGPEDVDREDLEAIASIQERIEELEEIDFSEVIKPQREAIKLELASLQTLLEAYQSVLETEGGEDDV